MIHDPPAQPLFLGEAGFSSESPRTALAQLPPLSLYIHIPWCVRKCPYCDFNSHTASPVLPEQEYVDALLADLDQDLPHVHGRELRSIFFGGGTPSLFSAEPLAVCWPVSSSASALPATSKSPWKLTPAPSSRSNSVPIGG